MSLSRNANPPPGGSSGSWFSDKRIVAVFATYGLLMGIVNYVNAFHSELNIILPFVLNFPAFLIILAIEYNLLNPMGIEAFYSNIVLIIPGSLFAWTLIGLAVSAAVRVYRTSLVRPRQA